jgi:hypothetical protein
MAFDYTALNTETVQPLIDEFGKDGQLSINVPDSGAEPYENQIGESVLHAVRLVQTVFKKADNMGTLVEAGDVLFIISTKGVTVDPQLADRMIVDTVKYQVVRVDPLMPGPVIMLWKIHARK